MKQFKQVPKNHNFINNLALRSLFENKEEDETIILKAEDCIDTTEETYAIDRYNDLGEVGICTDSFLYSSEYEYNQDCQILGL